MSVWVAEDRTLSVPPGACVVTRWIDIDCCVLGHRAQMAPASVERSFQRLLCQGDNATWPPVVGEWRGNRFVVKDGRHEYISSLMLGRTKLFVAWIKKGSGK